MIKIGDQFKTEFVVTEELYENFIKTSADNNILHTNSAYAKQMGFPDKFMHGNILCSKLSYIIGKCLPTEDVMIVNQSINFRAPFFLHDTITLDLIAKETIDFLPGIEFTFVFKRAAAEVIANGKIMIKLL